MEADAIIAGGGPTGLYLARLLEENGLKIALLEEHREIGSPSHCSGLISRNLDRFIRPGEWIEHKVSGAVFRSGSVGLRLKKPGIAAYVINRSDFDRSLSEGLGCIHVGTGLEAFSVTGEGASVKTNKGIFRSKMLIGCDGANSLVARHFGSRPKKMLQGTIAITREENHSDCVEIFLDKALARDGFFWKIPRGESTEYGMFAGRADFLSLENFFRLKLPYERRAGLIPMGPVKTYFDRALLVGDAAGMSKPWSGGGVIWGLTAARIASRTIIRAFEENDFSEGFLSSYERGWKKAFGRQIQAGMLGRKVFEKMEDPEVGLTLRAMGLFRPVINRMDMDFLTK
jgi:digeranylgeranylglycerophospholipid reductase